MGSIKLEFDIPEFEKELKIEIILSKDGEVVCTASSPSTGMIKEELPKSNNLVDKVLEDKTSPVITKTEKINSNQSSTPKKRFGGNMMDLEI